MYIVGNEITVTFVLPPQDPVPVEADFDVQFVPSTLEASYTNAGVTSFTAPTTTVAGLLTYAFTPASLGLFHLFISTGTADSYEVLAESRFWVFLEAPVTANSVIAHSQPSIPQSILLKSGTGVTGPWHDVGAIAEDPRDETVFWVMGQRLLGDTVGTIVKYRTNTQAVITEQKTVTTAYGGMPDVSGMAIMPNGRILASQLGATTGSDYLCFYSDDEGATWNTCVLSGGLNNFGGSSGLYYDTLLEGVWWYSQTKVWFSPDGQTFYAQEYSDFTFGRQPAQAMNKVIRYGSNIILGNNGNNTYVSNLQVPPTGGIPWTQMYNFIGMIASKQLIFLKPSPDGNSLVAISSDGWVAISSSGTGGWSITDHSSVLTGTMEEGCSVPDFNKMMVANSAGTWFESTDQGLTWALSTDIRFTAYQMSQVPGNFDTHSRGFANSGYGFVDVTTPLAERVVVVI